MSYEQVVNVTGLCVFLIFTLISILLLIRYNRIETPPDKDPPEILTGEHLKVKEKIRVIDRDSPPGTRVPEQNERKP